MIFERHFLIAYAALTMWAALLAAIPAFAMVFGILTLGLGFLIPSIWLYLTAMLPGLLLRRAGASCLSSVTVCILSVAALAMGPAWIAGAKAEQAIADYVSGDFRKPLPRRPASVELVRSEMAYATAGDDWIKHAACDEICQRLLLTRQVGSVSVVVRLPQIVSVTYVLATMDRCPTAFAHGTVVLSSMTRARMDGLCLVPSRGERMEQGISIRHATLHRTVIPSFSLVQVRAVQRLDVWEKRDGAVDHLLRNTEVKIEAASAPLMVGSYAGLLTSVSGNAIAKRERTVNSQSLLSIMEELGFSLAPAEVADRSRLLQTIIRISEKPLITDQDMVRSLLAQPGTDRFDSDLEVAVGMWTKQYWSGKAIPDERARATLIAVFLDRRISSAGSASEQWRGGPDLLAQLADAIMKRLTWPVETVTYDRDRQLAILLARQDDAFLSANKQRLLALVEGSLSRNTSPLLVAAARLGREGLPSLLAGIRSSDNQIRIDAIRAACRARPDIAADLSQSIETMLLEEGENDAFLIIALAALEGVGAAEEAIDRQPSKEQKRLRLILEHAVADDGTVRCTE